MFSQACKYAIRAMFLIAQRSQEGKFIGIKDIAEGLDAPQHFIAKILQDLSKRGFLISAKGPNGGFLVSENQRKITLMDIVIAVDGNKIITSCCLGLRDCSEKAPCPVHEEYKVIRKTISHMLTTTHISDYHDELSLSKLFLRDKILEVHNGN
jgi:Rrf2 family protein